MLGHLVDQAAFTPIRPTSAPSSLIYLELMDRFPIAHLNYLFRIIKERLQPSEKGASLANAIGRINCDHLKLEAFNDNIDHSQLVPSSAKTRLTIALRLRPTSKETSALQRLLNAEKTSKPSLSTDSPLCKWSECLVLQQHLHKGSRVHQASKQASALAWISQSPRIQSGKV